MKPIIQVRGLSKQYRIGEKRARYGSLRESLAHAAAAPLRLLKGQRKPEPAMIWALDDVSFDVMPGEVVGVIGRNGAGKSTLLKVLTRITEPTRGEVDLYGRVASLLEVGTGFHPELTGRENIYLNGAILGMRKAEIERKFDEIVAFAEVEKFLDTPVKHYSSGMYVRLAFAVAAHLEPEVLLVDEVLAVGDAAFQKKCLGKMSDVASSGRTVLFVSHNMAAVCQLCRRALWLSEGKAAGDGASQQTVESYLASGAFERPQSLWPSPETAPGDERVRLLGCKVLQQDQLASVVDINCAIEIELEFLALTRLTNLVSGVNFYNAMGTCLFAHCDWRPNEIAAGRYTKRVRIPAQTLAEGGHRVLVQLVFYEPTVNSVVLHDALSFDAVDGASLEAVRGPYRAGPWPGEVRLQLRWSEARRIGDGPQWRGRN